MTTLLTRRTLLASAAALWICGAAQAEPASWIPYPNRPEVQDFARTLAAGSDLPEDWILRTLGRARMSRRTVRMMQPAAQKKTAANYFTYRGRLLTLSRIQAGNAYWIRYADVLSQVEQTWGVPAKIILGILGIESMYGRSSGNFRCLDVLASLSFDYTRRAEYFRRELAAFLRMVHANGQDPVSVRSSFAGAIGPAQFMPGSIAKWGVDFDQDGKVDLVNSPADTIASVANYLARHGWNKSLPVLVPAKASEEAADRFGRGIKAEFTQADLTEAGIEISAAPPIPEASPVLLVDLPAAREDGTPATSWFVGTQNFAAILAYNHRYAYAAVVTELADMLRAPLVIRSSAQQD